MFKRKISYFVKGSHNAETIKKICCPNQIFKKENTYICYRQSFIPKQTPAATFPSKLSNLATKVGELRMEALFEPNSPY